MSNSRATLSGTIRGYFSDVFGGIGSLFGSLFTALPYLLNVKSGDLKKEVTEQYPDPVSSRSADELPPRTRGLLFNDIERCTGCKECQVACPVDCITVETEQGPDNARVWVSIFDIDNSRCVFCGLCVDACHPQSLVHTKEFEGVVETLPELVSSFGRGRLTPEQRSKWALARRNREMEDA